MDFTVRELAKLRQELAAYLPGECDVFVVGAFASQLWLHEHNQQPYRGTRDVDFVIGVPTYGAYATLRDDLAANWPRVQGTRGGHTLILRGGLVLDLLPFEAYVDRRDDRAYRELWQGPSELVGFTEVAQRGTRVYEVDGAKVESATAPALIGLKLIALNDRPERRLKDAEDIGQLIAYYPDFEDENVWDNHNDLFEEGVDMNQAGQTALGREVRAVFASNPPLCDRLAEVVEGLATGTHPGVTELARGLGRDGARVREVLRHLLTGFRQNWTPPTSASLPDG